MGLPPPNFRKIVLSPNLPDSNMYRSVAVDDGNDDSAIWLKETIGINSYIDLREKSEFFSTSKLDKHFILKTFFNKNDNLYNSNQSYRYHFGFFSIFFYLNTFLFKMNFYSKLKMLHLLINYLLYGDYEILKFIGRQLMGNGTLGQSYCLMLDDFPYIFYQIFSVMTNINNFPMLIGCQYGKDRTGIVCALVMQLIGCNDQLIIDEYAKSQDFLKPIQDEIDRKIRLYDLSPELGKSPPEAMETFLSYLNNKYGGAEGYLRVCGMTSHQISQIKTNITTPIVSAN